MPAFLVVIKDVDPEAVSAIDKDLIEGVVEEEIARNGAPGAVKAIEVPHVELMAAHAACKVVSESSLAGHSPPLTSVSRKMGMAGEDLKGEVGL